MRESATNKSKPEIVYVWDYLEWGGVYIYFLALMQEARKKWTVRTVLPEKSAARLFADMTEINVSWNTFAGHANISPAPNFRAKLQRRWDQLICERTLRRALTGKNLDNSILHLDLAPWSSFFSVLYLTVRSLAVVQTIHTPLPLLAPWRRFEWSAKFRILTGLPNYRLLASNNYARESLRPFVSEKVFAKINVAYSGVSQSEIEDILTHKASRAETAQKYNLPPETLWVFSLGQFIERKGCWTFLEAAQKLKSQNIMFVWLGIAAPDEQTLRRIESYEVPDSFRLLASQTSGETRREVLTLAAHADVFVLASLEEGLPIALVEAMSLRLACVATPVGAIPEAIEDGVTGLSLEVGNSDHLCELILRLEQHKNLRDRLARAAQKLAFDRFEQATASRTTLKVYEELWNQKTAKQ